MFDDEKFGELPRIVFTEFDWFIQKERPLLGGVRYSEVNLEGFHRIGSQIVCPLLGGVRYSACPLFRGFTV